MSTGKTAKFPGVSVKPLQDWEREGRLMPVARTDSKRRQETEAQMRGFIGLRQSLSEPTRRGVAGRWYPYGRPSSVYGWKG